MREENMAFTLNYIEKVMSLFLFNAHGQYLHY